MTPNVQRHNCSIYLGSWRRSEKQATFTLTENLWLHGRVVGWFFRGWAVRFMFRARPFVIMAECKQTDIIWRLLHQDLPLLHCCYTLLHGQNRPKKERVWYKRCHRRRRTGLDNLNRTRSIPHCRQIHVNRCIVVSCGCKSQVKSTKPLHTGFFLLGFDE